MSDIGYTSRQSVCKQLLLATSQICCAVNDFLPQIQLQAHVLAKPAKEPPPCFFNHTIPHMSDIRYTSRQSACKQLLLATYGVVAAQDHTPGSQDQMRTLLPTDYDAFETVWQ